MTKEYYQWLGLSDTANQDEIKKAYRQKAKIFHPDTATGNEAEFKKINEAYETLGDPAKRAEYDNPVQQFRFQAGAGNMNDIFSSIFRHHQQATPLKRYRVNISILDSLNGTSINIHGNTFNIPPGSQPGQVYVIGDNEQLIINIVADPKYQISGFNLVMQESVPIIDCVLGTTLKIKSICGKKLSVDLPSGSDFNTVLRIKGYGLLNNNRRQDLLIRILPIFPKSLTIEEKELYKRIRELKNEIS